MNALLVKVEVIWKSFSTLYRYNIVLTDNQNDNLVNYHFDYLLNYHSNIYNSF